MSRLRLPRGTALDAIVTFGAQAASAAVAFGVSVLLARRLGPAGTGLVQLAQTLGNQLALVLSVGVSVSLVRMIASQGASAEKRDWNPFSGGMLLVLLLLPLVVVATVVGAVCARRIDDGGQMAAAFTLAIPLAWLFVVQDLVSATLRGLNQYVEVAVLSLGSRVAFGTALTVVLFTSHSAVVAVAAILAVNALISIVFATIGIRRFGSSLRGSCAALSGLVRFNFRGYLATMIQEASYRLDLFLVAALLSTADAGVYAVAVVVISLLWYVPSAIGVVMLSRSAESSNSARVIAAARVTMAAMLVLTSATALAVPFVIPAFFGREFEGAVAPCLIMLPGALLISIWKVLMNALSGMGHPELKLPSALAGATTGLVLDIWLIPRLGIRGAALGACAAYTITTLCLLPVAAARLSTRSWTFLVPDFPSVKRILMPQPR